MLANIRIFTTGEGCSETVTGNSLFQGFRQHPPGKTHAGFRQLDEKTLVVRPRRHKINAHEPDAKAIFIEQRDINQKYIT